MFAELKTSSLVHQGKARHSLTEAGNLQQLWEPLLRLRGSVRSAQLFYREPPRSVPYTSRATVPTLPRKLLTDLLSTESQVADTMLAQTS